MNTTPLSLLERVCKASDPEAWAQFVRLYTPLIFYWARRCGLQAEDAADLVQDVFTTLVEKMPEFTYDRNKSFRSWLRTVTLNHWRDLRKRVGTRALPGDEGRLADLPAADAISVLEEEEYQRHLLGRALAMLRGDFQPATWRAFWEHGVLGRPAAEVAAELGLTVSAVYCARLRVLNRLRQELRGLWE